MSTPGVIGQTKLLLKKNWLSKKRQEKKKLFGEFFAPVFYLIILSVLVSLQNRKTYPEVSVEYEVPQNILNSLIYSRSDVDIYIVPDTQYEIDILDHVQSIWKRKRKGSTVELKPHYLPDEATLLTEYKKNGSINFALVFKSDGSNVYTIKLNPDGDILSPSPSPSPSDRKAGLDTCRARSDKIGENKNLEDPSTCPVNGFYYRNFLALQFLVDQAIIEIKSNQTMNVTVLLENYPKSQYNAGFAPYLRVLIPLYSVLPLAQIINNLLVLIVTEKEEKIKDCLRMTGVSDAAYWFSWFIFYAAYALFFALLFTLVLYFMNILGYMDPFLLFIIFSLFGFSVITFAFVLTPFFHKPKTAGIVGTLILQFASLLFLLQTFLQENTRTILIPLRLISSLAFTTALDEAGTLEETGGLQFTDLTFGGRGESTLISILFMIFDIFFYAVLAFYLDNIFPNQFGSKNEPFFCFRLKYWFRGSRNENEILLNNDSNQTIEDFGEEVEAVPISYGKEAIKIRQLCKTYKGNWRKKNDIHAVKGVSLDIYESQISCLIGKNGAGKSTIVGILTGLVQPTSGSVKVFGLNLKKPQDIAKLRKMIGVCMQYDLHFESLNVEEHLEFYGKLRGLSDEKLKQNIDKLIHDLSLEDRRQIQSSKLSGGEKRKLSIGIALIGSPKIIFLDEPTAGIDPVSRRHIWSLLQRTKEGKVILLTTHFMDEADILADRKAIIHDGLLKCVGSSLFLKNKFGVGYYLTVEMKSKNSSGQANESDLIIEKWIPSALNSKKALGTEIKYSLPHSEVSNFSNIFADYENLMESQGSEIKSYGISSTTLEDVFLKISNDIDLTNNLESLEESHNENGGIEESNLILSELGEINRSTLAILMALCKLRTLRLIRSPQSIFFMIFMPVLLVAIGFWIMKTQNLDSKSEINFSKLSEIYGKNELNVALFDESHNWESFISQNGMKVFNYTGIFKDLLQFQTASKDGTMSAINILSEIYDNDSNETEIELKLRINGTFLQSPPLMLNLIDRYIFSSLNISGGNDTIETINQPFTSKNLRKFDPSIFYAVFLIGPALIFPCIGLVIEVVKDREIKARNLLRVNGLSFSLYFGSLYIVFGVLSCFITVMLIGLIYAFQIPSLMNIYAMLTLIIFSFLFILPCFLFSSIFSYMFKKMETAQNIFSQISSWAGTFVAIAIMILDSTLTNTKITLAIHCVFSAIDIFYIPFGVFYWINKEYIICTITDNCDNLSMRNYMGTEFLVMYISLLVQIPVFYLILICIDVLHDGGNALDALGLRKLLGIKKLSGIDNELMQISPNLSHLSIPINEIDSDVLDEKVRVHTLLQNENHGVCVIAVEKLTKRYKSKKKGKKYKKLVLNGVTFMVEEGEVFGLLGHNGAGKTTAMKIIIAEERAESGRVQLSGLDITSNFSQAFHKLGYCPQQDVLWENITLREHLKLYAVLRGVSKDMQSRLVDHFINGLRIKEHADKKSYKLSGGTKRKLSYAMSMLGYPKIVLLDEPSTGMDPQSKRFLWNTVSGTFKESRGAILTTHSMEEADILCTRIGIMVKGTLICIGSPQHLKSKFGAGYTLEIKLKSEGVGTGDNSSDAFSFVNEIFQEAKLNENFGNRAIFSIPNSGIKSISTAFNLLEQAKRDNNIEEYSFSQTTLEQIFLSFSKDDDFE